MVTIYEVAERAGVSPATVSRVFNGAKVSDAKAEAVRAAAEALHFTPNRAARSLRRQNSEVIALIIPDIENPYFTELARGVEDIAQQAGYSVVLCNSDSDVEKEATYLRIAGAENMAGIILAAASNEPRLEQTLRDGRPIVAVDRSASVEIDRVVFDNIAAGIAATRHLVDIGYRRIACITGPADLETAQARVDGWRQVMREHRPDIDLSDLVHYSTFRVDGGRDAMSALLDSPDRPDAIVAANNLMGVGAIQVLTERGLTPPNIGVAVVGSLPFTTLTPDAVTTVRLPARHMGVTAANILLERIQGGTAPVHAVVLQSSLQPARHAPIARENRMKE